MKAQDVLPSLQEQMLKTGEKKTLVVDSEGIAVSTEILTHMSGLLDWATAFKGGPQLQQPHQEITLVYICRLILNDI